jgi:hypothetical protein
MLEYGRAASTRRRAIAARRSLRPLRPLGAMAAEMLELVANGIGTLTLLLAVRLMSCVLVSVSISSVSREGMYESTHQPPSLQGSAPAGYRVDVAFFLSTAL